MVVCNGRNMLQQSVTRRVMLHNLLCPYYLYSRRGT